MVQLFNFAKIGGLIILTIFAGSFLLYLIGRILGAGIGRSIQDVMNENKELEVTNAKDD